MKYSFLMLACIYTFAHAAFAINASELDELIAREKDAHQIESMGVFAPKSVTPGKLVYQFGDRSGLKMLDGQAVYLSVPESAQASAVEFVNLLHRQDYSTDPENNVNDVNHWDNTPAYTSVQVFDPSFVDGEQWRYWLGPGSTKAGGKFAETRSSHDPEAEGLYEWKRYGNGGVYGGVSATNVHPKFIRLVVTGKDTVYLHQLDVKLAPTETPDVYVEHIFSPGTNLGSFLDESGRDYGGGEKYSGTYPSALQIGSYSSSSLKKITSEIQAAGSTMTVQLPAGKKLIAFDLAAGDARGYDSENSTYLRGGAKITVRWKRGGQTIETLTVNESIGPQGVYRSRSAGSEKTQAGDIIEVQNTGIGTLYIMGLRAALQE